MSNNELLLAIYNDIQDLKQKMTNIETKVNNLEIKVDNLETKVDNIDIRVNNLETKVDNIEIGMANVEMTLENETNHNIQLLAENHGDLIDKLNQAIPIADKNLVYEVKVNYLLMEIDRLKKEIAEIKSKIA